MVITDGDYGQKYCHARVHRQLINWSIDYHITIRPISNWSISVGSGFCEECGVWICTPHCIRNIDIPAESTEKVRQMRPPPSEDFRCSRLGEVVNVVMHRRAVCSAIEDRPSHAWGYWLGSFRQRGRKSSVLRYATDQHYAQKKKIKLLSISWDFILSNRSVSVV